MKLSRQKHSLLAFLIFTLTFFFSCQKQDREVQVIQNDNLSNQVSNAKNLKEVTSFLNISGLDERLKRSLITTSYHYFSNSPTDQLWIISLAPGTYGFAKAKIAASLKDGQFSMIISSYNYDAALYKKEISAPIQEQLPFTIKN